MKQFLLLLSFICICRLSIAQNVGIGTTSPLYKLHVETTGTAIYGNSTGGSYGVYGKSTYLGVYGSGSSYGVYGLASGSYGVYGSGIYGVYGSGSSYGVYGYTSGSYGVYGNSSYVGVYGNGTTYGLSGAGSGSGSYGVSGSGTYIGVFGTSTAGTAVVGNSNSGNGGNFHSVSGYGLVAGTDKADKNWAGVFNGTVYTSSYYQTSDRNLKKNIQVLGDAMSIINKLQPKSYEFLKDNRLAKLGLPSGQHYGLLAQDLEEVLPDLVKEVMYVDPIAATAPDTSSSPVKNSSAVSAAAVNEQIVSKAVNYTELIPIIIKAMQEQQAIIDKQNEKIETLIELVNQLSKSNKKD